MNKRSQIIDILDSNGLTIIKISYEKKIDKISIYVLSKNELKEKTIREILEPYIDFTLFTKVEIFVENSISSDPIEQFIYSLKNTISSHKSWFNKDDISIEKNQIKYKAPNETTMYILEQKKLEIEKYLGPEYQVLFYCDKEEVVSEIKDSFQKNLLSEENNISIDIKENLPIIESKNISIQEKKNIELEKEFLFGKDKFTEPILIQGAVCPSNVTFVLDVFDLEEKILNNGKILIILSCSDNSDSRLVKIFLKEEELSNFRENISIGSHIMVYGKYDVDKFDNTPVLLARNIKLQEKVLRWDNSKEKRVEYHLHTNMSNTDGTHSIKDYVKLAASWGHKAIGITDHNVVQAFPEAMSASKKYDMQILYGVEADYIDDSKEIFTFKTNKYSGKKFVVFDIETTGFSPINDEITEIGAIKIEDGRIVDRFSEFVNPKRPIPEKIIELTGITDEMVKDADDVQTVLKRFEAFVDDCILVAHNASFDSRFIEYRRKGKEKFPIIDTLLLAQSLVTDTKNFKLGTLAKLYGISLVDAHRAVNDAQATAELFLILLEKAFKNGLNDIYDLNLLKHQNPEKLFPHHMTIYAKNKTGLLNLYKLISYSHMESFHRTARILKSQLNENREGLIIGSACRDGELVDAILRGAQHEELIEICKKYDFLEVQPPVRYRKLLKDNLLKDEQQIHDLIRLIISLGEETNKLVIATGDVHYLNPEDEILHDILSFSQNTFNATGEVEACFYTTNEMLSAFSFLGEKESVDLVVNNPNKLLLEFEKFDPIPSGKFPPKIKNSDIDLKNVAINQAKSIYGDDLPLIVQERLQKELDSIIGNGYAVMYKIAQDLVAQSNKDGFYVGSRGSVGSSFVATMTGITEVNPLAPHYVCPSCKYSEFITDGSYSSGIDLPKKSCPKCGHDLNRDGHQIPFEVFLGFYGDKEPDIDLNFAGEYQSKAHKFIEDWFGSGFVFRAGTIGTLAEKTAYGYVKKYCEVKEKYFSPLEIKRLSLGIVGVKRTSGQHPGGIMIVPTTNDIHEFTPIQYPADDKRKNVITTHFDYHSISENILKLDILGHDAPSILKMLEEFTGVTIDKVDLNDEKVMSLFLSQDSLKANEDIFKSPTGTLGIPEFGTSFVMKMLQETKPKTFSELVNISGLSHGTEVWTDNAQNLVNEGKATLSEVICTREDIMNYLIQAGADNKMAFDVMEAVRKGRGLPEKYLDKLQELTLPSWYLDSCRKIKYMFPKAHAVAYVTTSVRIAWYKIYYPEAFYASYFTTKLLDFNSQVINQSVEEIKQRIKKSYDFDASKKEKDEAIVLQMVLEMYARGFEFEMANLEHSHYSKFKILNGKILIPFQALSGVGETVAKSIYNEMKVREYISIEDLIRRTGASKTVIESLEEHGVLKGLAKNNQLSLMDILAN